MPGLILTNDSEHERSAMNTAQPPDRLPPLPDTALSDAQRQAAARLVAGPRGRLSGPFIPMLRSPELLERVQRLGEYLRFGGALPQRLKELGILVTAAHWRQRYEWHVHAPLALKAGVSADTIATLPDGRPAQMQDDEAVLYDLCSQLHRTHAVDDATYGRALALFGETGVVELCSLCGYYALLAMTLNVAGTQLPPGAVTPFDAPGVVPG